MITLVLQVGRLIGFTYMTNSILIDYASWGVVCTIYHSGHAISTADTTDGFLTPVKHGLAEIKVCERDVLAQRMWVFILLWKRIHRLWQCWRCIGVTKRKQTSDWTRRWRTVKRGNEINLESGNHGNHGNHETQDAIFLTFSNRVCDECRKFPIFLKLGPGNPKTLTGEGAPSTRFETRSFEEGEQNVEPNCIMTSCKVSSFFLRIQEF